MARIPPRVELTHWPVDGAERAIRAAFRVQNSWVVDAPRSPALWYKSVLSNLLSAYVRPDEDTLESVRTILHGGLSRTAFERLKFITGLSSEELSQAIGVPLRTLARRVTFEPDESERILRVASVFQKALEVLGSVELARRWFTAPKRALGDLTPLEFCDTGPGAEEVDHLLGRIEYGVFT